MAKYRAIVSIEFDDDDLDELAEQFGTEIDPHMMLSGELDNLSFGSAWIEQIFEDDKETILRLSGGIMVEVNPHG